MAAEHVPFDDVNFPIVECSRGPIRGRRCLDYQGVPYYSFVRVPYGECPTGPNRFKHLERRQARRWTDPLDCTMDIEAGPSPAFSEEKCLYCNIYTPKLNKEILRLQPVMVFIPGENPAIDKHTGLEKYGPQYLMTEKVVVVVLAYRSGILGFAKVQSEHLKTQVPGYAAHSDISAFFPWLLANIKRFGGSPDDITVFGHGLGAAMISDMLYDVTLTWPNVTKVILQSINGDSLLGYEHINIKDYAIFCGFANADHTEEQVLDILKALPVDQLLSREKAFLKRVPLRQLNFNFLRPMRAGKAGAGIASVMIGFNSNEGILDKILNPKIDVKFGDVDRLLWHIKLPNKKYVGPVLRSSLVPKVKDYFFKGQPPTQEKFMQILSDLRHNLRTLATTRLMPTTMNRFASIFFYRFDVDGAMNLVKRTANRDDVRTIPGACFGDELGYLFKVPGLPEPEPGSVEEATVRRMIRIWANFARDAEPNLIEPHCEILGDLRWRSLNEDWFCGSKPMRCMDIGPRLEFTGRLPELYRFCFWSNIWIDLALKGELAHVKKLFFLK